MILFAAVIFKHFFLLLTGTSFLAFSIFFLHYITYRPSVSLFSAVFVKIFCFLCFFFSGVIHFITDFFLKGVKKASTLNPLDPDCRLSAAELNIVVNPATIRVIHSYSVWIIYLRRETAAPAKSA